MHTLHAALAEPDPAEPFLPPPNHRHALGDMPAGTSAGPKPAGWSNIRHISAQLFKKNPNAYFYRHTEPGVVCVWHKRSCTCQVYFVVGILVWISLCQPVSCSIDTPHHPTAPASRRVVRRRASPFPQGKPAVLAPYNSLNTAISIPGARS